MTTSSTGTCNKATGILLMSSIERRVERFLQVYDFGNDGRHDISTESVPDGEADVDHPGFVGRPAPVPDEGHSAASRLTAVLEKQRSTAPRRAQRGGDWDGKPFDPVDIDERWAWLSLSTLAARRRAALGLHRSATPPN